MALGAPPFSIDPLLATDATGMRFVSLTHQSLVKIGTDLKAAPDLAHKWTVLGDSYTFYIKKDTKFSDGSAIECTDLIRSIKSYKDPKCPFNRAFTPIVKESCSEDKDNNLILSLKLKEASAKFLLSDLPVLKIISKSQKGSGAFVLVDKKPTQYTLEPNTHSIKKLNYKLVFYFLKDDFSRFLKTYKGEIDIAPNSIPFEKVNSFKDTKFKILERPSLSTSYLLINFKNKDLSRLATRKLIYSDIDIPDLVTNRFDNHVTLAKSLLSPEHPYFSKELHSKNHKTAINTKAQSSPGIIRLKTSNSRQSIETGKIIAQKLRDKGMPIQVQSFEWGTFYRDIKMGQYDMALMKWVGVIDPDQYNVAFHSDEFPPGRNRGYYKNLKLDRILDEARVELDLRKRQKFYNMVQNTVFEDLAIIPLWHENQIHVVHPRVKNYKVNPMGDFTSLEALRITEEKL